MTVTEHVEDPQLEAEDVVYCTVHPTVATSLRCNRCGRPMCTKCAVKTPVGYRCKECVRQQQDKFFDAQMVDYLVAGGVSLVLSFVVAALFAMFLRFGFFVIYLGIFLGPAAGTAIGSVIYRMTRKRRGRHTALVVGAGVVLGALPWLFFNPLGVGIFLVLGTGAAVARFRLKL